MEDSNSDVIGRRRVDFNREVGREEPPDKDTRVGGRDDEGGFFMFYVFVCEGRWLGSSFFVDQLGFISLSLSLS